MCSVEHQIRAIQSENFKQVIDVAVPVRFYWNEDGFDGVSFGPFTRDLLP